MYNVFYILLTISCIVATPAFSAQYTPSSSSHPYYAKPDSKALVFSNEKTQFITYLPNGKLLVYERLFLFLDASPTLNPETSWHNLIESVVNTQYPWIGIVIHQPHGKPLSIYLARTFVRAIADKNINFNPETDTFSFVTLSPEFYSNPYHLSHAKEMPMEILFPLPNTITYNPITHYFEAANGYKNDYSWALPRTITQQEPIAASEALPTITQNRESATAKPEATLSAITSHTELPVPSTTPEPANSLSKEERKRLKKERLAKERVTKNAIESNPSIKNEQSPKKQQALDSAEQAKRDAQREADKEKSRLENEEKKHKAEADAAAALAKAQQKEKERLAAIKAQQEAACLKSSSKKNSSSKKEEDVDIDALVLQLKLTIAPKESIEDILKAAEEEKATKIELSNETEKKISDIANNKVLPLSVREKAYNIMIPSWQSMLSIDFTQRILDAKTSKRKAKQHNDLLYLKKIGSFDYFITLGQSSGFTLGKILFSFRKICHHDDFRSCPGKECFIKQHIHELRRAEGAEDNTPLADIFLAYVLKNHPCACTNEQEALERYLESTVIYQKLAHRADATPAVQEKIAALLKENDTFKVVKKIDGKTDVHVKGYVDLTQPDGFSKLSDISIAFSEYKKGLTKGEECRRLLPTMFIAKVMNTSKIEKQSSDFLYKVATNIIESISYAEFYDFSQALGGYNKNHPFIEQLYRTTHFHIKRGHFKHTMPITIDGIYEYCKTNISPETELSTLSIEQKIQVFTDIFLQTDLDSTNVIEHKNYLLLKEISEIILKDISVQDMQKIVNFLYCTDHWLITPLVKKLSAELKKIAPQYVHNHSAPEYPLVKSIGASVNFFLCRLMMLAKDDKKSPYLAKNSALSSYKPITPNTLEELLTKDDLLAGARSEGNEFFAGIDGASSMNSTTLSSTV